LNVHWIEINFSREIQGMQNPERAIQAKEWYSCDISRQELKSFLKRDNYHAILYFGVWFVLLFAAGLLASRLYPTPWAIPAFFFYGVIYASANARWHECSHGTAFKTIWPNEFSIFCAAPWSFGLSRFYGGFFQWTFIWLQHVGLAENV
jgi:fatty acid desaturase